MSEVSDILKRYREIKAWFRHPPNAVPDTPIDLRKHKSTAASPIPPVSRPPPLPPPSLAWSSLPLPEGLTFSSTLKVTAKAFGVTAEDLISPSRRKEVTMPRHVAMYLFAKQGSWTVSWIGSRFNRDHTTVMYARDKITALIETDYKLKSKVIQIEDRLAALRPPFAATANSEYALATGEGEESLSEPALPRLDRTG